MCHGTGRWLSSPRAPWHLVQSCQQHLQGLALPVAQVAVAVQGVVGAVQPEEHGRVPVLHGHPGLEGDLRRGTAKVQSSQNLGVLGMFPFLCKRELAQHTARVRLNCRHSHSHSLPSRSLGLRSPTGTFHIPLAPCFTPACPHPPQPTDTSTEH